VCTRENSTLPIKVYAVLLVQAAHPPAQQLKPFSAEQRTIIVVPAVQATTLLLLGFARQQCATAVLDTLLWLSNATKIV
jgi:hypothetical protein